MVCIEILVGLHVLHVEVLRHVAHCDLESRLCKGLAEADALATIERSPTGRQALCAGWCQRKRIVVVETLGDELVRALPFLGVGVETVEVEEDLLAGLQVVFSYLGILGQRVLRRDWAGRE